MLANVTIRQLANVLLATAACFNHALMLWFYIRFTQHKSYICLQFAIKEVVVDEEVGILKKNKMLFAAFLFVYLLAVCDLGTSVPLLKLVQNTVSVLQ